MREDRDDLLAQIVAFLPRLRAFCISVARDDVRGEDLAHTTVALALSNLHSFESGTNLHAWLFTIARNRYRSEWRKLRREVEDAHGVFCGISVVRATSVPLERLLVGGEDDAVARLDYRRAEEGMDLLPADQREALQAVCIAGMSYEDAADVLGVAVGTIKSRVSRARSRLAEIMDGYEMRGVDDSSSEEEAAWRALVATGALDDYGEGLDDA